MPLIIITGIPSSGKTSTTQKLKEYFEDKQVHIVSELDEIIKAGYEKNEFYLDSTKEKHIRSLLKSQVTSLLSSQNLVILDALNYIKGYRYELFCVSKSTKTTQCTVHLQINYEEAWKYNEQRSEIKEKYTRPIFDALIQRYEEPNEKNRWDSPLFTLNSFVNLDFKAVSKVLFDKAPPPPNQSTQNVPLNSTNFLYDLDQTTKKMVDSIIQCKNMGLTTTKIDGFDENLDISNVSVQNLLILKRQFLTYSKMHPPQNDSKSVSALFGQYLKTALNK